MLHGDEFAKRYHVEETNPRHSLNCTRRLRPMGRLSCRIAPYAAIVTLAMIALSPALLLAASAAETEKPAPPPQPQPAVAPAPVTTTPADAEISELLKKLAETISRADSAATADKAAEISPSEILTPADAVKMTPVKNLPPDSTKLITLPKLSKLEINELSDQLVLNLGTQLNYVSVISALSEILPSPPKGVVGDTTIARMADGSAYILRFGYRHYVTQPPQLWTLGVIVGPDGKLSANPDLAGIEPAITKMIADLNAMRAGLQIRDLEAKLIQLSYVDADTALSMLKGLGMTTVASAAAIPAKVDFAQLPFVVKIEDPKSTYTGLIGSKTTTANNKLSMTPGVASDMSDNAIGTPMTQLLVMFHPAHPGQFSQVRSALDEYIDRPARQIFIEGMVLEISEQGLKDLGVDWTLNTWSKEDGTAVITKLRGGSEYAGSTQDTLEAIIPDTSTLHNIFTGKFQWNWEVTLRALIRAGKAQVLSRPSVLTLNNRQSTIRVGKDIPIASSLQGNNYSSISAFKFEYLPTGILLNIRPRINEEGKEVTMLIDTIVSAPVPNEDLEMRSADGKSVLAQAPTVSTRRVQTYGRIANNTPLIIGGLVADERISIQDKIPLLGDLPVLGAMFRSEKVESEKREVIIVLTPHVLPEKREVRRSFPKDEDAFDNFGNDLFRDSYRIRGEDVFDLTFLLENQRITSYRNLAREVAEKNFRLGAAEPFRAFVRDSIPGENILVTRMIYEVIKRLDIAAKIDQSRIIYFESQQVGGYNVKFLDKILTDKTTGKLKDLGDKAIAVTYHRDRASLQEGRLGSEPIPDIEIVDCPDRDAWSTKLWELNQLADDGRERYTILIKDESDIVRLRRALALKRIVVLNGGADQLRLKNFSVGKTLLMPELKNEQIHVIDADTAMYFFHTEHYYAATLRVIEEQLKELDKMLRRPDISMLLDSGLPNGNSEGNGI